MIFHVGLHKTATSWMQRFLFVRTCGYTQMLSHEEVDRYICRPNRLYFDAKVVSRVLANRKASASAEDIPIVSSELLCGQPFFGSRETVDYAQRIHAIDSAAKIILTIRPQSQLIASLYMQYLRRGGTMPPRLFFETPEVLGYTTFDSCMLEMDRLIDLYDGLFGRSHVLVLNQEQLKTDKDSFVHALAKFCGLSSDLAVVPQQGASGVSDKEQVVPILRRLNHLHSGPLNPSPFVDGGFATRWLIRIVGRVSRIEKFSSAIKAYRPVSSVVEEMFCGRFIDSNKRMAALRPELCVKGFEGLSD